MAATGFAGKLFVGGNEVAIDAWSIGIERKTPEITSRVRDLMRAVRLNPLDLLARFELADAIEDDMQCDPADVWPAIQLPDGVEVERDERGMPWGIRCRMGQWVEEGCKYCENGLEGLAEIGANVIYCRLCNNTSPIESLAARVCRVWPVGSVELKNADPDTDAPVHPELKPYWVYYRESKVVSDAGVIPDELFDLLTVEVPIGEFGGGTIFKGKGRNDLFWQYKEVAKSVLNRSALNLGRQRAGLPML